MSGLPRTRSRGLNVFGTESANERPEGGESRATAPKLRRHNAVRASARLLSPLVNRKASPIDGRRGSSPGAPIHVMQATLDQASVATTRGYLHARPTDSSSRPLAV
jgi:hypothetical protein